MKFVCYTMMMMMTAVTAWPKFFERLSPYCPFATNNNWQVGGSQTRAHRLAGSLRAAISLHLALRTASSPPKEMLRQR